jgi:hypothetical protein
VWARNVLFLGLCAVGLLALGASLSPEHKPLPDQGLYLRQGSGDDFLASVARLDAALDIAWTAAKVEPVGRADDLAIARRLSLALAGTIPSLEQIRLFEAAPSDRRLDEFLASILDDRSCHEYLAERLARSYVGVHVGSFVVFRRSRFVSWLADQLEARRPYNRIVREMIADTGMGTDQPATNFVLATIKPGNDTFQPDPNELAARVSRAFLGVRIDCAECHDHPFQPWKQADFQGLAAFFAGTRQRITGLQDLGGKYEVENRITGKLETIEPRVPFDAELVPAQGTPRARLAAWVTDEDNPNFARAIVNRTWALMFGRGLVEPVDDIRAGESTPRALDVLAEDFVQHGYNLSRLIQVIATSRVYRLDSKAASAEQAISGEQEAAWAVFPLTRLRPEQVCGAVVQAASLETIDHESHVLLRIARSFNFGDFIKRYGDSGADELAEEGSTIPQRLLMMNGKLVNEKTKTKGLNATNQIVMLASNPQRAIETTYLATLTRRPTSAEAQHFAERLSDKNVKTAQLVEDLFWTLVNSTEFSWNH